MVQQVALIEAGLSSQQLDSTMNSAPIAVLQISETHSSQQKPEHQQQKRFESSQQQHQQQHRRENSASSAFYSADVDISSPTFQLILGECGLDPCGVPITTSNDSLDQDEDDSFIADPQYRQFIPLSVQVLELVLRATESLRTQVLLSFFGTVQPPVVHTSTTSSFSSEPVSKKSSQPSAGVLRSLSFSGIKDTVMSKLLGNNKRDTKTTETTPALQSATNDCMFSDVCTTDCTDFLKTDCSDDGGLFRNMVYSITEHIYFRTSFEPSVFVTAALYLDRAFRRCDGSISAVLRALYADGEVTFLDEDRAILDFLQGKPIAEPANSSIPYWMQQFVASRQHDKRPRSTNIAPVIYRAASRAISLLIGKLYIICILLSAKMQEDVCYSRWQSRAYWSLVKDLLKNEEQWFPPIHFTLESTACASKPTPRKRKLKDWANSARQRLSLTTPFITPAATAVASSPTRCRTPISFQEFVSMERSLFRSMSFNLYISTSEFRSFVGQNTSPDSLNELMSGLIQSDPVYTHC